MCSSVKILLPCGLNEDNLRTLDDTDRCTHDANESIAAFFRRLDVRLSMKRNYKSQDRSEDSFL